MNTSSRIPRASPNRPCRILQGPGVFWPEPITPLPDGHIGNRNSTLGQDVLDISEAQTEAMVEPDCVADDFWRESVSVVQRFSIFHPISLTD